MPKSKILNQVQDLVRHDRFRVQHDNIVNQRTVTLNLFQGLRGV
jgi:hypothetical protein